VGLKPERELPVIWKITKGSLRNKLIVLLPLALILGYFAPSFIMPLLMIGGVYLAFEGTEKLVEFFIPHKEEEHEEAKGTTAKQIEETTVSGAIRTDFILSAEIMALTLAGLAPSSIYTQAAILAAVGILITFAVYGVVGIIVKLDDMGVSLVRNSHTAFGRQLGKGLVAGMPIILKVLSTVGTIAMLWVGGSIIVHGLDSIGIHSVEAFIHSIVSHLPTEGTRFSAAFEWIATSFLQAVLAILIGIVVVFAVNIFKSLKAKV
jgi:predicted DNA repair protein MutK